MVQHDNKPVIGFSCGDLNGIGTEIIIKTLSDNRLLELFTPVIFANNRLLNFYKKTIPESNFNYTTVKDSSRMNTKHVNVFHCWENDVAITPGQLTEDGGKYAVASLQVATEALLAGKIDGLVTAPIHKKNVQGENFNFSGHTPFLKEMFGVQDVLMLMVAQNMKVGLLTEHVPVTEISTHITKDAIRKKLDLLNHSLQNDFGINKPKIAVLALNPHAGDEGLVGKEEIDIIRPAIREAKQKNVFCFGPYAADAFFARGLHEKFDAVLAMYHDQGLVPFKSLANGEGVNFTAGLSRVRTSPDHGVAFDIAGKGIADESSMRQAIYTCLDIIDMRNEISYQYRNPLGKISAVVVANSVDERIPLDEN